MAIARIVIVRQNHERIGEDMATDRQIAYYKSLCQQLGQEPDDDFENLTVSEASEAITELNEMLEGK